jgi:hypothetical protein
MHRDGNERRLLGCGAGEDGKMTYEEWRAIVESHYGGLHMFTDATTVRHWFAETSKRASNLLEMSETVRITCSDAVYQEFKDAFSGELRTNIDASKELWRWLKDRNLEPAVREKMGEAQ